MNNSNETNKTDSDNSCSYYHIFKPIIASVIVLSVLCIIITILAYSCISKLKNLHGKILTSLSGCLGTMYFLLLLDVYLQPFLPSSVCVTMGTVTYIMFIATFFWLNVMAYDLWKTICVTSASKRNKGKSYLRYSLYVWTSTIITCIPMIVVQNTNLVSENFHPGLGNGVCWFVGYYSPLIYMSAPIGVILLVNLLMFVLTMKTLVQINKLTQIYEFRQNKIQFKLYFKLFFVMGLVWVTDFFPFIFNNCHLYLISDVLNSLHGFFLFLIFICKKKIFIHLFDFFRRHICECSCNKSSFQLNSQNAEENFGSTGGFSTTTTTTDF